MELFQKVFFFAPLHENIEKSSTNPSKKIIRNKKINKNDERNKKNNIKLR
jgi:hypothetical protein